MTSFRIRPEELPGILKAHQKALPAAVDHGLFMAATRAHKWLVSTSPVGVSGQYKQSWKVVRRPIGRGGHTVRNDAPHAGIIELGARPHGVNAEGLAALANWAKKKILKGGAKASGPVQRDKGKGRKAFNASVLDAMAMDIARRIAWKLMKYGQKPTFHVAKAMPQITKWAQQEVARAINKALMQKKPAAPNGSTT